MKQQNQPLLHLMKFSFLSAEVEPHVERFFEDALKEGLNVGLDLSREEREFHQVQQGLVLLFHS